MIIPKITGPITCQSKPRRRGPDKSEWKSSFDPKLVPPAPPKGSLSSCCWPPFCWWAPWWWLWYMLFDKLFETWGEMLELLAALFWLFNESWKFVAACTISFWFWTSFPFPPPPPPNGSLPPPILLDDSSLLFSFNPLETPFSTTSSASAWWLSDSV